MNKRIRSCQIADKDKPSIDQLEEYSTLAKHFAAVLENPLIPNAIKMSIIETLKIKNSGGQYSYKNIGYIAAAISGNQS